MAAAELDIRPSPIAGIWYSDNEAILREELSNYLNLYAGSEVLLSAETLLSLVVPHAGYRYSGATAAAAFQALRGRQYQKVLIISPSHRAYTDPLLSSGHEAYQTPLGLVRVDRESLLLLNEELTKNRRNLKLVRFDQEHALEIELPFLQITLENDFELIPIMMVDQSYVTAVALADSLFALINRFSADENVLLIASTDLSHFHHQREAKKRDAAFISALENGDVNQLYQAYYDRKTEACGLGPTATVLLLSEMLGANKIRIMDYRDSSYESNDKSSVVGYVSAVISREEEYNV